MRKCIYNLLALILGIFISLIMLEVGLNIHLSRFSEQGFDMRELHNKSVSSAVPFNNFTHYRYSTMLNNEGFRDINWALEKKPGVTRVAVIGDSFTFGYGIDNTHDTYPKQLERELGTGYEVMNFGLPGANVLDIYWVYRNHVLKYDPDIVIYGFFQNDVEFRNENKDIGYCEALMPWPHSFRWLLGKLSSMKKTETLVDYLQEGRLEKACTEELLKRMDSKEVILFFVPGSASPDVEVSKMYSKITEIAKESGAEIVPEVTTMFWDMTGNEELKYRVSPEEGEMHYSSEGARFLAEMLAWHLKQ
ncbi:MAG: hypothetical protein HGA85_01985 [Nanoarchaeota archaeon]|nr:hypothetical protein [Nanoarchaeota archaeon]